TRVFNIGQPIGGAAASAAVSRRSADHTVVSVGPYRLVTAPPAPQSCTHSPPLSASPPTSIRTPPSPPAASLATACPSVGVPCITLAPLSRSARISAGGSCTVSRAATTTLAPLISGR